MQNYFVGELLGTMILVLLGSGVTANSVLNKCKGVGIGWFGITTGWAFAIMFGIFVAQAAGSIQADINPAVTLSKYYLQVYPDFYQVLLQIVAQIVGAFIGATIVWLAYWPHWELTADKNKKLEIFVTSPAIKHTYGNFFCEVTGTFVLVLGIGALIANANIMGGLTPYLIGILFWSIGLSLGGPTGYSINPARDLGPRLAHAILPIAGKGSSDWNYAWIPFLGPIVGGMLGAIVWNFVFIG